MDDRYVRKDEESFEQFELRCFSDKWKYNDISWNMLTEILNEESGRNLDESTYRKKFNKLKNTNGIIHTDTFEQNFDIEENTNSTDDLKEILFQLKKEKVKLSDERSQANSYFRRISREDTIKEIAHDFAKEMTSKKFLIPPVKKELEEIEEQGILMLSDWHFGIEIANHFNTYNEDVFIDRLAQLKNQVIEILEKKHFEKLHVVNLSDLIAGGIHTKIRLQSRFDVISQIMMVSEYLAMLLNDLSEYCVIEYHDVLDNHSRFDPIKENSLDFESLCRIIPWYLKERLHDNRNIIIEDDQSANDITEFDIYDYHITCVHGHKDKPSKVVNNMFGILNTKSDLILTAHYHHLACEEQYNCVRIANGSLMGTDNFAEDLRLTNKSSQTLVVVNPYNACKEIHRLLLE